MTGIVFDVRGSIKPITDHLTNFAKKQVPFATVLALTRTAKFIEQKIKEEMPRVFSNPTKFTLNSLYVQPATKARLYAMVKIKDEVSNAVNPPIKWLAPQVYGGPRSRKRFEDLLMQRNAMPAGMFAIPAASTALDQYGNPPRGMLNRVLSDLHAQFDVLADASVASRKRRAGRKNRVARFYFSTYPPNKKTAHLRPGIYERMSSKHVRGSGIRPAFIFVRQPRYRKRLHFFEIADQAGPMRFKLEFALAMKYALATARA